MRAAGSAVDHPNLHRYEQVQLANLCPADVYEARILIPRCAIAPVVFVCACARVCVCVCVSVCVRVRVCASVCVFA
jgi:hypothetical protein